MRRQVLLGLGAIALAGCSSGEDKPAAQAEGGDRIECALAGAGEFTPSCAVDRAQVDGRLTLIVRHPDGAFRRFEVVNDGRGLVAADGAEHAVTAVKGDKLAVTVADDRYLFPARIKPSESHAGQ